MTTLRAASEASDGVLEYPSCPACGQMDVPPPLLYEASRFSDGHVVGLSRCSRCHVYFTRPRLVHHNEHTKQGTFEKVMKKYKKRAERKRFHRDPTHRLYLDLARKRLERAGRRGPFSVLDIGAHCGFFLRQAQRKGWRAFGVEPSANHARFAREVNGIESIENGYFDDDTFPGERFDLITFLDVLEHIDHPVEILSAARARLNPHGVVLCKVPHLGFYEFWRKPVALLGKLGVLPWYPTFESEPPPDQRDAPRSGFFDLFEHVVHYERGSIEAIFSRAGFDTVELRAAPPNNPPGHLLNFPRAVFYQLGRLERLVARRPGPLTHGLIIIAS